ncbi:acyl-CoA transferase [Rhodanobacter thiooxydans]|uniref:Acyl-CoA transferase n=1 Tax=Rhodanobacter thiooxydans TaxID=416169 RepID=A0A154QFE5_9GAMM|nr:CoA transferase [Rhodanobacter thiooxydans]EIL99324.1 acyl-CoA transferase/carnitine dehydratase [Rhodanobacter thiooxydans LCS2]KZC22519.1 acyl-CoA transferase [Rhodanobacter thiooxydans]MCW0202145.1 CoA transferase [Rhodanobacter thiooxydans]
MSKALEGTRVLDLTHMLSGPYAGMILADLGAETIKVEPLTGEGTRALLARDPKHSLHGMGAYFLTLNRSKRSVCVDLKHPQGLAVFHDLVRVSDVVIDNFSAGVTAKLGIDHAQLSGINERIITCSISGFGQDGPNYLRPAFDQVVQGIGGGMSITGENAERPMRSGIPIGDLGGGMFAVMGVLAALQARSRHGRGQHVDISMLDCQISMLNYMATMHLMSGENPEPLGNGHFVHVPYNTYRTADGFIIVAVIFDSFWERLVELLDVQALRDPAYLQQPGRLASKAAIDAKLNEIFATNSTAHWVERLGSARVPCAPVNRFSEALADPQVLHRRMVVEIPHPEGGAVRAPGNPIKLSVDDGDDYGAPPLLGQHTRSVLFDLLGYDTARIDSLHSDKVVG